MCSESKLLGLAVPHRGELVPETRGWGILFQLPMHVKFAYHFLVQSKFFRVLTQVVALSFLLRHLLSCLAIRPRSMQFQLGSIVFGL